MTTSTGDAAAPYTVAIVAMGPSKSDYIEACVKKSSRFEVADETWAINAMAGCIVHDRAIIMDALPYFEMVGRTSEHHSGYGRWLRQHPGPIYTQERYPGFPGSVEYPLEDVINTVGFPYFNNTCAYAIGLAILLKVRHLKLFGMDFTPKSAQDGARVEAGRACVESLIRDCTWRKMTVEIANSSTLCDQHLGRPFYGYSFPPKVEFANNRYTVTHPQHETNVRTHGTSKPNGSSRPDESAGPGTGHGVVPKHDAVNGNDPRVIRDEAAVRHGPRTAPAAPVGKLAKRTNGAAAGPSHAARKRRK